MIRVTGSADSRRGGGALSARRSAAGAGKLARGVGLSPVDLEHTGRKDQARSRPDVQGDLVLGRRAIAIEHAVNSKISSGRWRKRAVAEVLHVEALLAQVIHVEAADVV